MTIREEPDEISRRPFNSTIAVAVIVMIIAAVALLIGFLVFLSISQNNAADVIRVPRDYATIQAAIDAANPGQIILVSAGVYVENLNLNKPVSLVAETFDQINPANNQTIIDGGGGATAILIPPGLTQMPSIRGFVIQNSADGIQASSEFIAEFNFLHSATSHVSYQKGGGGFNRNNVYFNAGGNAIRLVDVDRPILIENNRIMYSGESGIEISLQNTNIPPALIEINIWNNMILGNREDGIQVLDYANDPQDTNRRIVIVGNLIADNTKAGIGLMPNANTVEDYSGADVVEAIRVYNNTFYGNDYGISGGDNLVAFNNIIVNSANIGAWRVEGPAGANSVVAYTLFHNNRLDSDQSAIGAGVFAGLDPLFVAAPNPGPDGAWETVDDDFSGLVLQSTSPAIDKGVTQYIAANGEPVPPSPITGFIGAAPDLGWREFGAPIFPTPTPTAVASSTPLHTATPATLTAVPSTTSTLPVSPTPLTASPTIASTLTPITPVVSATVGTSTASAQVTIQTVAPNTPVTANTTVVLTITGSGFQSGALVTFEGGLGLPQEVVSVQVVGANTIQVTVTARNDGSSGAQVWDVRVTNPDTSTAVLVDAFTVIPAP